MILTNQSELYVKILMKFSVSKNFINEKLFVEFIRYCTEVASLEHYQK
jgi:hypothetical protein